MIRIYNFPAPSRALRPIWLCEEMALPYEVSMISFPAGEDFRARFPLGKVPFLEDEGGVAIGESIAMLFYLAQKYGPTPLLPGKDDPAFARVEEMTLFSEASFGAAINPLLATRFFAPEDQKTSWLASYMEQRCVAHLDYIEGQLGAGPYLAGERFTLADIGIGSSIGMWTGAVGKPVSEKLAAYQARITARPAFARAMQRATGK